MRKSLRPKRALRIARALWGPTAWVMQSAAPHPDLRCQVGFTCAGQRCPLGNGRTFREAFERARKLGHKPSAIREVLAHFAAKEEEEHGEEPTPTAAEG